VGSALPVQPRRFDELRRRPETQPRPCGPRRRDRVSPRSRHHR